MAALRPRIQQIADDLITGFAGRGHADLVTEFAQPVPMTVIAELLGVPAADRGEFARLTNIYAGVDEGDVARIPQALATIRGYLSDLIAAKERGPGHQHEAAADAEAGDLLDGLIAARDDGGRLDHDELLAMAFVLLAAGYETTAGLIGNAVLALLSNPDQLAALRADPDLIGPAIEEFLRYDPPVKITAPDRLDIRRTDSSGHLAFSHGLHYCLGAPLARAEGQIAITALLDSCRDLTLAVEPGELSWRHSRLVRSLRRLPVTFTQ